MAYCAQSDIESRVESRLLVQLADEDGDGVADTAVVAAAISDADALIDSYVGSRYTVPFETVPAVIIQMSARLAIYFLKRRRFQTIEEEDSREYRDVVKFLEAVRDGKMELMREGKTEVDLPWSNKDGLDGKFGAGGTMLDDF